MFQYEKTPEGYWIWSEKMSGKFGPFTGIYVKNNVLGDFPATFDIRAYPAHKYALGKGGWSIFILTHECCTEIIHEE